MKWYRFWKKVQGYEAGEDYRQFPNHASEKDLILPECEFWAKYCVSGGSNVGYRLGFEEVEKPPKEYIIKEIKKLKKSMGKSQDKLDEYEFILKTYSVKAKIEKIKDNIKLWNTE